MKNYILAAALLSTSLTTVSLAEDFDTPVQAGEARIAKGWVGTAYDKPDGSGRSHCFVESRQISREGVESVLAIKLTSTGHLEVMFGADDWKLTKGKDYSVAVQADDAEPLETTGKAWGGTGMFIWFTTQQAVAQTLDTLAASSVLTIYRGKKALKAYTLENSSKAINWLFKCHGVGGSSGETFEPAAPTAPKISPKGPKVES